MFFRPSWWLLLAPFFSVASEPPPTKSTQFVAQPDTCVALREGRKCYADVLLSWQQPQIGNYCLRNATTKYIMQCWLKQQQGTFRYAFDSSESIAFELFDSNSAKVLASTEVKLQWVYQNRQKKRRWRLF